MEMPELIAFIVGMITVGFIGYMFYTNIFGDD